MNGITLNWIRKHCKALIFGVKKFHQFVYDRKFVLTTDHKPLLGKFGDGEAVPQNGFSEILTLAGYDYKLKLASTWECGLPEPFTFGGTVSNSDIPGEVIQSLDIVKQLVDACSHYQGTNI